jgi:hypothetical protein
MILIWFPLQHLCGNIRKKDFFWYGLVRIGVGCNLWTDDSE